MRVKLEVSIQISNRSEKSELFHCEWCSYTSKKITLLMSHMNKKHKSLVQLDANNYLVELETESEKEAHDDKKEVMPIVMEICDQSYLYLHYT